ncbi:CgeB family protein [Listeria rustica]|uniref:Glycosyltransferase n=1 Tax=Listeria rustica TaxID=2713503 RepID=A0A7W1T4N6_9LIST|nr:glycosyltransferase [Listeria rustica]MBA3925418.1 glycosyltransferase [Listeria rustica]
MEIKKKNNFEEQISHVYNTIASFQNELMTDLYPVFLPEEQLKDVNQWWYVKEEGLEVYEEAGDLVFKNADERSNYTSFKEENVAFTRMPRYQIDVLPEETIAVHVEAEVDSGVSVRIAIVEYDGQKKTTTTMVDVNKEAQIMLGQTSKHIRLALKITGKGLIRIKKMAFRRIFSPKKSQSPRVLSQDPFQHIKHLHELKVACIFDEFTMTSYKEEVDLITFTPENWQEVLEENPPHFLFVESAWHGNFDTWQYKVGRYANEDRQELFDLLDWCKERGIPTVFWNKEDPIHFDKFIDSAKRFDYIYTTDANRIPDYVKHAKHRNVFALPFAAEPKHHNPIQLPESREDGVCFAGSYYANRHEERREVMDQMLEISDAFNLAIYDRNYERSEPEFRFPKQFEKNVKGSLAYSEIDKAYKGYRFMLNVNSVIHSPTMFSRRVFEGMASGTPILSSYSEGIDKIFGNLVMIAQKPEDLRAQMKEISEDEQLYRKKSLEGIREVYGKHTYKHRLQFMLENMKKNIQLAETEVSVISFVQSEQAVVNVIKAFNKQSYLTKKLYLFARSVDDFKDFNHIINTYQSETVSIFLLDYMQNYKQLTDFIDSDFITFWNQNHFYGRHYLKDLMLASVYTDADFIGKGSYYEKDAEQCEERYMENEYRFVTSLRSTRSILKTNYPFRKNVKALLVEFMHGADLSPYMNQGAKMFSADKYNFIENGTHVGEEWLHHVEI